MYFQHLKNRRLLSLSGEDAETFLDNLVTCNVLALDKGDSTFGALLTPQGKILFDFFLSRTSDEYIVDADSELADELAKRLTFYRLRAKVDIQPVDDTLQVFACWGEKPDKGYKDIRHAQAGWRVYSSVTPDGEVSDYIFHCIQLGIPNGGADFSYGDAYPHEVLMDQFGGVDFKKGCYVGQEVVSRMQHRGTAKKRIIHIKGDAPLPPAGTAILGDGKPAGTIGSISGNQGLALLRLDRTAKADALEADGISLKASIQNWVNFNWPKADNGEE